MFHYWRYIFLIAATIVGGCGKDNGNNGNNGNTNDNGGGCQGNCGPGGSPGSGGGQAGLAVTADVKGAAGLLVIDTGGSAKLADLGFSIAGSPDSLDAEASSGKDSLQKVKSDGTVGSAITAESTGNSGPTKSDGNGGNSPSTGSTSSPGSSGTNDSNNNNNGGPPAPKLPKILTIAIAPNGEMYLHFANPFMTAETIKKTECQSDAWNTPGCQCQLFRVKGGSYKTLIAKDAEPDNLECIDPTHYANSWQTQRNSVFQFDSSSNVYYPASPAGNDGGGGKMVVYKRTQNGSATTEMINSNICVNDFLVTKSGGMFYTGSSACGSSAGGGGGFFRYVAPTSGGGVREIARNWWNFVFEPLENSTSDFALFFGPDPRSATTATWNTACLFKFDPSKSTASEAITDVITCGSDIGSWIDMRRDEDKKLYGRGYSDGEQSPSADWKTEYRKRCESEGQVFAGGGSQISAVKQDSTGSIYVIGNVRKKNKGKIACDVQVRGAHCVVEGVPYAANINDPTSKYATKSTCTTAGGTWVDSPGQCKTSSGNYPTSSLSTKDACLGADSTNKWYYDVKNYNNVATTACYATDNIVTNIWSTDVTATGSSTSPTEGQPKMQSGWWRCNSTVTTAGDQWTSEYNALAKVNTTTKALDMLSSVDEQAGRLWLVKDVAYFSTYNTSKGRYYLKRWDNSSSKSVELAENFEAYNVSQSDSDTKVFYDGLDFSNNSYSFGTMLIASPYTRTQTTGLTGTVKTIVILPK